MLSRIKKRIILAAMAGTMCLTSVAFAEDSTISYITINDKVYEDVEIMIGQGQEILVPFKLLASMFEIKYEANRVDKLITFISFDGKSGAITADNITLDGAIIQTRKPIFLKQGLMDNVMNEAFISAKSAEQIFGIKLETDYSSLTLAAHIDRDVNVLRNSTNEWNEDKGPKAHPDTILPKKSGVITLKRIGIHNDMVNDNMSTRWYDSHVINDTVSGNTQLAILGDAFGGKYRAEANMFHYRQDAFFFGGASATYMNKFKNKKNDKDYWYELGKVKGKSDVDSEIGTNIFGAQIFNYDYQKEHPSELKGYVKPTSLVRVSVNGGEPVTIDTYSGYWSLKDFPLPEKVQAIKVEEINEDGSIELVKEERYQLYGDRPFKDEERGSVYAGVWGYQNRLFREGQNIYFGNNKKATVGGYYQKGLKDNVTFESKLTGDKIYDKHNPKTVYRIPTNDTLLVSGTQKYVNYQEGATSLNSIEYISEKDPNFKARATGGVSIAHDIREHETKGGYMGKGTLEYSKDLQKHKWWIIRPKSSKIKMEAYHTSPDFYIASSDSTSKNDRTGGRVQGSLRFNSTGVSGGYNKYYSNINHRYEGGTIKFDEYNINASTVVPKVANVRYNIFHKRGSNDFGRNKNYNYDFNVSRELGRWARVEGGQRQSLYDTKYDVETTNNTNFYSRYKDIYANVDIPIPKNKGKFSFGHDFIKYRAANYHNDYNMFKFGYTFPTWKRLTLSLGWGFRYHGQGGNDLRVNLAYRAKSGQMMNVGYQYSKNGGYFIDNMFTPTTSRHSVNFMFNDALQVFNHGFKSVGDEYADKGIFEAVAFIDVNKNGKYDKNLDIPVKDIPIATSWSSDKFYTNKRGRVASAAISTGVYKISLDMNSLPITVAPLTNDVITKTVKIESGLTTKLELPLASTVGSVSGVLKISDDFDRNLKITDFVVVILDANGEEVNYSTVGESGEFYISGLAPGKYKLRLDERFVDAYGLEELPNSSIDIFIPFDYNNPTDLTEQNLEYRAMAL
ncbi:hypothetical protein IJ750_05805 [bacterium]|nr:hypothetical protein [bacterium]MBR1776568.1 hypothetical protein [bacterium]